MVRISDGTLTSAPLTQTVEVAQVITEANNDFRAVATGDFDGDGNADFVAANHSTGQLYLYLGQGDGHFDQAVVFAIGSGALAAVAADLGNGALDVVVANSGDGTVSVLLNDGTGTFTTAQTLAAGSSPGALALGAFLGDGRKALAVADRADGTVRVFANDGSGSFSLAAVLDVGTGACTLAAADLNGDGVDDLVVADADGDTLWVLLSDGAGSFSAPVGYAVGQAPSAVVTADFDGDGRADVAVANGGSGSVSVLLGKGDGTFVLAREYAVGGTPVAMVVLAGGAGLPGLLVASRGTDSQAVLANVGHGYFVVSHTIPLGHSPDAVAVADFDGDGVLDYAADGKVEVGKVSRGTPGSTLVSSLLEYIPEDRIGGMLDKRNPLATKMGGYVHVADIINGRVVHLLYERVALDRDPLTGKRDLDAGGKPNYYYKLVYSHTSMLSMSKDALPVDEVLARHRRDSSIRRHVSMLEHNRATGRVESKTALGTFFLHAIPFGAFWDNLAKGERGEATLSLLGDMAMFAGGPLANLVKSGTRAKALRVGAGVTELGLAGTRGTQAYFALKKGDTDQAAGYIGEALLRLVGVSAQAIAARKSKLARTEAEAAAKAETAAAAQSRAVSLPNNSNASVVPRTITDANEARLLGLQVGDTLHEVRVGGPNGELRAVYRNEAQALARRDRLNLPQLLPEQEFQALQQQARQRTISPEDMERLRGQWRARAVRDAEAAQAAPVRRTVAEVDEETRLLQDVFKQHGHDSPQAAEARKRINALGREKRSIQAADSAKLAEAWRRWWSGQGPYPGTYPLPPG